MAWGEGGKGRAREEGRVSRARDGRETGAHLADSPHVPQVEELVRARAEPRWSRRGENFTQCTAASWPSRSMMGASSDEELDARRA